MLLSFYDVQNEVSHKRGTFKVLYLTPTTPNCGVGGSNSTLDCPIRCQRAFDTLRRSKVMVEVVVFWGVGGVCFEERCVVGFRLDGIIRCLYRYF